MDSDGSVLTGRRLGPYDVQDSIGAGGMGVVYRALDTRLSRSVAIKVLSDAVADPASRRRFQREAQTASSLNHPHILTVYDAGEFEGRQYLVTELVDGGTLRVWRQAGARDWRETIELLIGVADALATAHDAGILHRDVKPENILITRSGYAKLADFGLAKLHDRGTAEDTPTVTDLRTRPGAIVGTVAYMSPEQALGRAVDARSDIFSFGVTLYEALAGRRPFAGASEIDVLHAIAHSPPAPLPDDLPLQVRLLVEKAIEKDPANRYQSMRDLMVDLRRIVRQSGEALPRPRAYRVPKRGVWLPAAVAGVLIVAAVAWFAIGSRQSPESTRRDMEPLTNFADSATQPALSPDGRMLTFIRGQGSLSGPGQVYVKLLPGGEAVRLTNDEVIKVNPQFSPDGTQIAYTTMVDDRTLDTWIVPVLGGQPRPLLKNASGLTWIRSTPAPAVLFSEFTGRGFHMSIVTSSESRSGLRTVYLPPTEAGMAHRSYLSPDGKYVLLTEMDSTGWLPCRLVPFDGSSVGTPAGPSPAQCTDAAWSPDGKWMYFSTNAGNGAHIWRQRFPNGTPEQVTFGATEEEGVHFAPDGRSFLTSIGSRQSTVWIHDSRGDRQLTSEGFAFFPQMSSDAKKVFYLERTGGSGLYPTGALWTMDVGSGQRQRLLPDFQVIHYSISRDGQRVLFVASEQRGPGSLWLAPIDGSSPPRRLTKQETQVAYFGAPGEIVFLAEEKPAWFIFRMNEDGSGLRKVSSTPMLLPFGVSPDGRWVPAAEGPSPETRNAVMLHPIDGGEPRLICRCYPAPDIENGPMPPQLSWTPDGKYLYLKFAGSTYAIPLRSGQLWPTVPDSGFPSKEAVAAVPGARLISDQEWVFPGPNPAVYAFMKITAQRNIYRVPVP